MKEIALTQGQFALVDDADFDFLNQWKWQANKQPSTFYATRNKLLSEPGKAGISIRMHRVLLGLTDPNILCDHIDHNGLNNQRSNLRIATHVQNVINRSKRKSSPSKYLGVFLELRNNKIRWVATINKNKKTIHLGRFELEEDAARAYDVAAKIHHGEFANLNFK